MLDLIIYIFIHEVFEEFLFLNYISCKYFIQSLLYKYYNSNRKREKDKKIIVIRKREKREKI